MFLKVTPTVAESNLMIHYYQARNQRPKKHTCALASKECPETHDSSDYVLIDPRDFQKETQAQSQQTSRAWLWGWA